MLQYDSLPNQLQKIVDEAVGEIETNYQGIFYS